MDLLSRLRHRDPPAPAPINREALREEMTRQDPAFARVRQRHHEALQTLTAKRLQDSIAIKQEAEFWRRHGREQGSP